jgi:hypothetical protein
LNAIANTGRLPLKSSADQRFELSHRFNASPQLYMK